ncbi:hypothetical protein Daus18300_013841 [Diaporthe australafricana]|uniref:Uncharacterized protein n=1 Tax=Diaporthe australafricana TaxID=127596 RepID=A0ABR3VXK5_9PEZI
MESNLAQDATAEEDENTSRITLFLAVPAEIRNKIYRHALVQAERGQRPGDRICGLSQPALTRANKQIRSEALPIYYGQNFFQLNIASSMGECVPNDWSSFVRMFSVFKAGRTGGWGTGSLQFIQDIECRIDCPRISCRWTPTVTFKADSEPHGNSYTGPILEDASVGKKKNCQIPDVAYIYRDLEYHF